MTITWEDFEKIDVRAGTIIEVQDFPKARQPAYKLTIDLGPAIGLKKSSAQITNYAAADLIGKQVLCVVNFAPKQVADFMSEVLVTGFVLPDKTILSVSQQTVPNGSKLS